MIRKRLHIIVFCVLIMSSFAFVPKDKTTLFQETLSKRLENYKQELLDDCKQDALDEAEMKVDSIIAVELGAGPIDTIDFPRKPRKPSFESFDSLKNEQIELKPLFDKNSIQTDSF